MSHDTCPNLVSEIENKVVEVEIDLLADTGHKAQLDVLVKVQVDIAALFDGDVLILDVRVFDAELDFHTTGRPDIDSITAENALENVTADVELRDDSAATPVAAAVRGAVVVPVIVDALAQVVTHILVHVHIGTRAKGPVARHILEIVGVGLRIVLYLGADTRRVLEPEGTLVRVVQRIDRAGNCAGRIGVRRENAHLRQCRHPLGHCIKFSPLQA